MTNVLLVEDDERISEPLIRVLRAEAFDVVHVAAGRPALASVANAVPDLVLLDLTLPDIDGLDVCRKLRADHPDLPVIMLTARAEEMDVIVGLNAGADDYVAKPFRLAELVACIHARLRIGQHHAENLVPAAPTGRSPWWPPRTHGPAPSHVHIVTARRPALTKPTRRTRSDGSDPATWAEKAETPGFQREEWPYSASPDPSSVSSVRQEGAVGLKSPGPGADC